MWGIPTIPRWWSGLLGTTDSLGISDFWKATSTRRNSPSLLTFFVHPNIPIGDWGAATLGFCETHLEGILISGCHDHTSDNFRSSQIHMIHTILASLRAPTIWIYGCGESPSWVINKRMYHLNSPPDFHPLPSLLHRWLFPGFLLN